MQVQSQAWHRGVRSQGCCSCGLGGNCSSDLIPRLGAPYAVGQSKKEKKKKKKKKKKAYTEKERTKRVDKNILNDEKYVPDDTVKKKKKRFQEFQETPATRLLKSSKSAAEGIMNTMDMYAEEELDIDTAKKLSAILKDVSGIIKSLDLASKQAKAEQAETGRVKGGGVIGMYE